MGMGESLADAVDNPGRFLLLNGLAVCRVVEGLAIDILHDDVGHAVDLPEIVDADEVGVVDWPKADGDVDVLGNEPDGLAAGLRCKAKVRYRQADQECVVTAGTDGNLIDGKSIMALLMLGAPVGTELELEVEGEDESAAIAAIRELIEAGFHELEE